MESLKINGLTSNIAQRLAFYHGQIVALDDHSLAVLDPENNLHAIDLIADSIMDYEVGDDVIFTRLGKGEIVLINVLRSKKSPPPHHDKVLFSKAEQSISVDEDGIHLQAGKSTITLKKDGVIEIKGLSIQQNAKENLALKSQMIHIN